MYNCFDKLMYQTLAPYYSLEERRRRTRRTFLVNTLTIRSWKKLAGDLSPSKFVSIAARVLVTVASVRGLANDNGPLIAVFLTDCRSRLDPPVDDGYIGNCISYCFALMTASEIARPGGFVRACVALREVTVHVNPKYSSSKLCYFKNSLIN
jgi:Transferase family